MTPENEQLEGDASRDDCSDDVHPANATASQSAECGEMMASDNPTVLETIRGLHARSINGKNLSKDDRRAVVEHLSADGLSVAQIAEILKVSERTIKRDRRAIQQANAIEADPQFLSQMVGRMMGEAELSISKIRAACRDKEADPATRIDGEHRCFLIGRDMVHLLQRLGYLPTATQRLEAHLTHSTEELPNVSDLQFQLQQLRLVAKSDSAALARLSNLEQSLIKVNVLEGIAQMGGDLSKEVDNESPE